MGKKSNSRNVNDTITALFEISNAVNSKDNLDDLYVSIHSSLNKILNLENFAIAIFNEEKDSMTFPYFVDEIDEELGEVFEISKKQSLSAQVIHAGKPLIFYEEDIIRMPDRNGRIAHHSACKVWAGAPLKTKGRPFGVLIVQSYRSRNAFKKRDLKLLNSVAEFIAVSIESKQIQMARIQTEEINAVLREVVSAVHNTENLDQLYRHIHRSLGRLMDISNFFIALYDSNQKTIDFDYFVDQFDEALPRIESLIQPNSLTGEVIIGKQPLLLRESVLLERAENKKIVGTLPKIWLGVPLIIRDNVIGVVAVQSYENPDLYDMEDLKVLSVVSHQIALAIHRKRAEDALKENEARYRLLADSLSDLSNQTEQLSLAAASMISMKNEKEFFNKISKAIVEFSDFKRVIISLFKEKPPFRDIIASGGVEEEIVDRLRKVEMPKKWYDKVFVDKNNIGQFSYYIPHTQKEILNQEATIYGSGPEPVFDNRWHPEDNLFVRMNDEKGHIIGVISVDDSKSGLKPCAETVRPLEIFSSLISQIVIFKKEQDERKKIEEQLRQTQKMEAIGTLAGGIAHDFNNILSGILGYSELIQEDLKNSGCRSVTGKRMERVIKASLRAKDLVGQILDFSRSSRKDPISISVILIVKEVLQLLKASLPSSIKIDQALNSNNCVMADPTGIYQMLMNLCTNAKDAMSEKGGTLFLGVKDATLSAEDIAGYEEILPGHFILISVKDTGHGMEKEVINRILEPFYTTKADGKGTGMGLSVVHGIVKSLNGFMKISSIPGKGSTFDVFLPIHERVSEPKHQMLNEIENCEGTEKILIVDDEQTLAEMTHDSLKHFGYDATFFSNSKKAFEHFKNKSEEYDLIISDITMPDMTGNFFVEQIRSVHPGMPVILCTGYNEFIDKEKADQMQINALLYKPVPAKDLLLTIRSVLDGESYGKHLDH